MKLPHYLRVVLWVIILILACAGMPLGPVPLMKKDDEPSVKIELVEEQKDEEADEEVRF